MFHQNVDISQINSRFLIAGQCWKNRTDIAGERNNIDEFKDYVTRKFNRKVLLCRFGASDKILRNEIWFDMPEYNINNVYNTAKGIYGWLKLDSQNIVILEIRGNIHKFLYVASCILKFAKFFVKSHDACQYIIKTRYNSTKIMNNTLLRYLQYFDAVDLSKPKATCKTLKLKQIIVAGYPTFSCNSVKPFFELSYDNTKIKCNDIKMLVDSNFIIGEFDEIYLKTDCIFRLFYSETSKTYPVFEINLNAAFMEESLCRYQKEDVTFLLSEFLVKTHVSNNFLVDIVLLDGRSENRAVYNVDTSVASCLKTLSLHLKNDADHFELKKLIKEGYNSLYSRVYLQLNYTYDEVVAILQSLNIKEGGFHKHRDKKPPKSENQIQFATKKPETTDKTESPNKKITLGSKPFKKRQYLEEYSFLETDIADLELIPDILKMKKPVEKLHKKSPFAKRTTKIAPLDSPNAAINDSHLIAKKPLHWTVINDTDSTIFERTESIVVSLDMDKFEEWFCEPVAKETTEKLVTKKTIIKDEQRLFLISIALKTLEKRQIDVYDLDEILYTRAFELSYEDLQNILRVLPTEIEMRSLLDYKKSNPGKSSLRNLNQIEQMLMVNMDSYELRNIISILMFERKFIDEYEHIEKLLLKLKNNYYKIIDNKNLRVILKVLLDIGNLINVKYAKQRVRKDSKGFKITSLQTMTRYTGIKMNNRLTTFLFMTLVKEKPDVFAIFEELRDLKDIRIESFEPIKENINGFINDYNRSRSMLGLIDSLHQNSDKMKLFLGFAHEKLKYFTDVFKEIVLVSSLIKRKFGENEEININEILTTIYEFLQKIEEEYKIHTI